MAKKELVKVKTEDWNDLLKASAKREPMKKTIQVKDAEPKPGVLVRFSVKSNNIEQDGIPLTEVKKENPVWYAVENVKEALKDNTSNNVDVCYSSTYEEAIKWADDFNKNGV